ncbi:Uncharacterized conserved protein, DUF983 family [Yoonia tamlensis]|uniref:Uncharacterized conserved protein, DUF983 family n=1 Tax=Yoonia tamlensis TaxID=390270 RepID=A0A1I6FW10_9RHOB|nr:DUF983 domain-containing protein [Yoonia tamlensis]SFR34123.1 Uncharacterized conserved protein, DUF983 family [Yoonia tamlensis]
MTDAPTYEMERPSKPAMLRGLRCKCPNCGEANLFSRYLKVVDQCPHCAETLSHHRADDGPAYLTILLVAHILGFAIHFMWVMWQPSPMVMATTLATGAVALSLFLLPRLKGMIVAIQWARRMHGFGHQP